MASRKVQKHNTEAARASMQTAQPQDRATRLRYNYEELAGPPLAIQQTLSLEYDRIDNMAEPISGNFKRRIYGIGCGGS